MNIEKIGSVTLNYEYYDESLHYSDGDEVEDFIVSVLKEGRRSVDVLANDNRWAVLYHLSPCRANIVNPMKIGLNDDVLEIGAGFGAITAALSKKAKSVDCIELSKRRSVGNAYRNKESDNIDIYVGSFEKIRLNKLYDAVALVGVLEYAGLYISDKEPYVSFLRRMSDLLKPGGRIYIAIENRLGIKYFSGAPEDHLGVSYAGVEGYLNPEWRFKTFSRSELFALVQNAGFSEPFFYYPLPDYKLPRVIYSDSYLPRKGDGLPALTNYDMERISPFSEESALRSILGTDEFKILTNSFLLECVKI